MSVKHGQLIKIQLLLLQEVQLFQPLLQDHQEILNKQAKFKVERAQTQSVPQIFHCLVLPHNSLSK
jgi:hypothetical protein